MDPLDMMAMEEMMGGGMGGGAPEDQMVSVMVPAWTVPAVEELVSILSEEGGNGMMPMDEASAMEGELAF